jgi:signal transduction histidine kinase
MKLRHASISVRLAAWFATILFLGWFSFGIAMRFELEHVLTDSRYQTLSRRADRLSDLLHKLQDASDKERERKYQDFATATGDGLIDVFQADGSREFPAPSAEAQAFPWPKPNSQEQFVKVRTNGQKFRVLCKRLQIGSSNYYVCLAAPLAGNLRLLDSFSWGLVLAIPVLLLGSALGGYFVCRHALAPVDRITAAVRSITVWNLSGRLSVPKTNDELQRLAETCNKMLGRMENAIARIRQFTSNASHELRNPLCFARTTAEVALLNNNLDAVSQQSFQEIVDECAKASVMLDDLLTLARADAGNLDRRFASVHLASLVALVCNKAEHRAFAKGHTLSLHCEVSDNLMVYGDALILERLVWILLDNAIKYTPAAGRISVSVARHEQQLLLEVEDNGVGISATDLPHVCERFYRSERTRDLAEGSGLGLAIAQWIADIHHTTLTIMPHPSKGTRIQVAFPLYQQ